MPHVTNGSDDADLASSDEVKVFKDEGEGDDDRRSSSDGEDDPTEMVKELNEVKQRLIDEEERQGSSGSTRNPSSPSHHPSAVISSSSSSSHHTPRSSSNSIHDHLSHHHPHHPFGYPFNVPFHHAHNSTVSGASKMSAMVAPHPASPSLFGAMMQNMESYLQPPPAHMSSSLDGKTGIPRPSVYSQSSAYGLFPDLPWASSLYPMTSTAFRPSYPTSMTSASQSNFSRYTGQSLIPPYPPHFGHPSTLNHPLLSGSKHHPHPDIVAAMVQTHLDSSRALHSYQSQLPPLSQSSSSSLTMPDQKPTPHLSLTSTKLLNGSTSSPSSHSARNSSPATTEDKERRLSLGNHHHHHNNHHQNNRLNHHNKNSSDSNSSSSSRNNNSDSESNGHNLSNMSHVKKPLNAFMLYMKEHRNSVVQEHMLKESAAINQILGKRWHSLTREEQATYYEKARLERQKHQQLYPGWTARDNYAINQKKKKKKRDKSADGEPGSLKKCRARYGLDQQQMWCKPCRRKKKCIRYMENGEQGNGVIERDNLGSVGSTEAQTPDSKSANESDGDHMNLSSADLSMSSPPVPNTEAHHLLLPPPHHRSLFPRNHHDQRSRASQSHGSSLIAALHAPPRNSPTAPNHPFSIDQLARPHHSALV